MKALGPSIVFAIGFFFISVYHNPPKKQSENLKSRIAISEKMNELRIQRADTRLTLMIQSKEDITQQ